MNEGISVLVALLIIVLVLRWLFGRPNDGANAARSSQRPSGLRGSPRVTREQIDSIKAMFPDLNEAAIAYDLLRTGSTQVTTENILRNGTLRMPPNPAAVLPAGVRRTPPQPSSGSSYSSSHQANPINHNLIKRYQLEDRITQETASDQLDKEPERVWESTADKRQEILKARKQHMVLQARRKLLERQAKAANTISSSSTPVSVTKSASVDTMSSFEDIGNDI
ncbi:hypothetical protein BZG36_01272 [Bifiguratus adelaidae]|uniref:CUE domain-containing protein n=1 Tax=Bifiguratus adelaidae TaxID=1938954 RepID=A0A261Y5A7_9FUNG|nr:hypothetical protein BZG36_01272 [Bifiguratus adelaidae]